MRFTGNTSFRTRAQHRHLSGLGNVFEDISNWAGGAKGDAKQWLDENIGGGAGNIAEGIGNEAVDYGKNIATQTANEQISKLINSGGGNTSSPPITTNQTASPPIQQNTQQPPIQQQNTQPRTTTNEGKNIVQKINPLYTVGGSALVLGFTTKSPTWTIFGSIALGIIHHAYNANRS